MKITQLPETIKAVAFHAGFSHYLFDHKDSKKRARLQAIPRPVIMKGSRYQAHRIWYCLSYEVMFVSVSFPLNGSQIQLNIKTNGLLQVFLKIMLLYSFLIHYKYNAVCILS